MKIEYAMPKESVSSTPVKSSRKPLQIVKAKQPIARRQGNNAIQKRQGRENTKNAGGAGR